MPFPFKINVVGLGVFAAVQVTPAIAWNYTDTQWTGACSSSSPNQSPIDIRVAGVAEGSVQTPPQEFNFDWQGFPDSATTSSIQGGLTINDHTWEVEWDTGNSAENKYGMVIDDKLYRLRQFHYHSPSEHTVDGNHYDMEAHYVHFCEGPNCDPTSDDDEILVVAVFLKVGQANAYLQSFWNQFSPSVETESIEFMPNPYTEFMPTDKSYYSYIGSTTTPPCATNVQWRLMQQPVEMSQEQLTAYHTAVNTLSQPAIPLEQPAGVSPGWVANTKTNNRPIQPLGDRPVLLFAPPQPATAVSQFPWMPLLVGLAAVALLTAGICMYLNASNKESKTAKRAVKPRPPKEAPKEAPKEETVPLMPPPLLAAPNLSMVAAQPLMQAVPQVYTTAARPVAMAPPYGQPAVVLQP